ncbi:hypothetical protein [Streptomyces xiaopingdaonensis]|uniref:hypothetical protein n=1 Tax=Streptomyces xiaopingdaonensis TaxID=1565415 RepID=UPI0002E0E09F|nr:hypothetical protein [Streptomyces xiaopingdaonensis]
MAMVAGPRDNGEARADRPRGAGAGGPGTDYSRRGLPEQPRLGDAAPEPASAEPEGEQDAEELEPQELRPRRKLRLWQLAPIVVFAALGSLMFAFPLAFEPGGSSGAVVSMLGLLLCGCAAGGALVAARRVGHRWPGMSGGGGPERADWRAVALYALLFCTVVALAVLRIARLR